MMRSARKKHEGKDRDLFASIYYAPLTRKDAIISGVIGIFVLLLIVMVILMFCYESSPQSVLEQTINNYEYFLKGREITRYENELMGQGDSDIYIETSVSLEKIPELLKTNILKECEAEGFTCSDPIWYKSNSIGASQRTTGNSPWRIMHQTSKEYCTSAVNLKNPGDKRTDACIDVSTGIITFNFVNI